MFENVKFLVVGAGFSGSVIAERIANVLNESVLVIDSKLHVGGNSYSETDSASGIECHRYGSHIFHTSSESVWNYIRRFTEFNSYQHKVLTTYQGYVYQMPINLKTVNDYYGLNLKPWEAQEFIRKEAEMAGISEVRNLEEKAISLIGEKLYTAFIRGYTKKQWERDPKELPAEIITRLPVRSNYNANYFQDPYQGIPLDGYGALFRNLLNHPKIEVRLGVNFFEIRDQIPSACTVIYTGMVDQFFDYCHGPLDWRSLRFEWETKDLSDWQGTAVMNYADEEIPYTRIHEFKHYHPERKAVFESDKTVICREYSQTYTPGKEAYYPVNNAENNRKYEKYQAMAKAMPHVILAGRLANYRYWDMDQAINNSLCLFEQIKKDLENGK